MNTKLRCPLLPSFAVVLAVAPLWAQAPAPAPLQVEFRPLAHAGYDRNGVRFDLDQERQRLQAWLEQPVNRAAVRNNPFAISGFKQKTLPARIMRCRRC